MDASPRDRGTSTGSDTRDRIVRAAEHLFAAHGIDGVSLREINRAAGQSNTGAVQYYFGDRTGLVLAVIGKHRGDDEIRRHALLDEYERVGHDDLHALASALVAPIAANLADQDGGRQYLRISAEFYLRATPHEAPPRRRVADSSYRRWNTLLDGVAPVKEKALTSARFPAVRFTLMELSRRAAAPARRDDELFVAKLTDLVTSVLATRPSPGTARMVEAHRARRAAEPADVVD